MTDEELKARERYPTPIMSDEELTAIEQYARSLPNVIFADHLKRLVGEARSMRDVLTAIIYASDGCVGHRDCNHSVQPWKDARALLGFLTTPDDEPSAPPSR